MNITTRVQGRPVTAPAPPSFWVWLGLVAKRLHGNYIIGLFYFSLAIAYLMIANDEPIIAQAITSSSGGLMTPTSLVILFWICGALLLFHPKRRNIKLMFWLSLPLILITMFYAVTVMGTPVNNLRAITGGVLDLAVISIIVSEQYRQQSEAIIAQHNDNRYKQDAVALLTYIIKKTTSDGCMTMAQWKVVLNEYETHGQLPPDRPL